jgi:hypothetical protein
MPTADRPLTLHWVLDGPLDLNDPVQMGLRDFAGNPLPEPDVYDIDGEFNSAATVRALQARGKKVICYFDAGVFETYRTDAHKFPREVIGNPDEGWDGSYWLDNRRIDVLEPIMRARMQMCRDKGFDAIEPDEIDGYSNNPGFPLTYQDQLRYNKALARWAHELGMSIGLKGDIDQAADLADDFDWTLNEECYEFNECTPALRSFTQRNKAVWIAEYKNYSATTWAAICANSRAERFNTARYQLGLPRNGGRQPC